LSELFRSCAVDTANRPTSYFQHIRLYSSIFAVTFSRKTVASRLSRVNTALHVERHRPVRTPRGAGPVEVVHRMWSESVIPVKGTMPTSRANRRTI
jgi:hypothetical protein